MTRPVADPVYEQALAAVQAAVEKVASLLRDFGAIVANAIAVLPIPRAWLVDQFNKLMAEIIKALDVIRRLVTERGDAGAVRQVADAWINQVGQMMTDQASRVDRSQMESFGNWSGPAADKYVTVALAQKDAITAVRSIAVEKVPSILSEIADELSNFWVLVATEAAGWAAFITICCLTPALGGPAAAVYATAALVGLLIQQLTSHANKLSSWANKFNQLNTLGVPFPGNTWPPVKESQLADASTKDGDKSDWKHVT